MKNLARYNTAVIGGGAAGMMAAITASAQGEKVLLLEKSDKLGRKILISGNGRCNVTNLDSDCITHYHGAPPAFLRSVLGHMPLQETLAFFRDLGVEVHEEKRGRLFPRSNQAQSIVDVLEDRLILQGVDLCLGAEVVYVRREDDAFAVKKADGTLFSADRLIIASGGISAPKLGADRAIMDLVCAMGHETTPLLPGLVALESSAAYLERMQGVKLVAAVQARLPGRGRVVDVDDVLLARYGVSGFSILNLSAQVVPLLQHGPVELSLNLFPDCSSEYVSELLKERWERNPHRTLEGSFAGLINAKLVRHLLDHGELDRSQRVGGMGKAARWKLARLLTDWRIPVHGPRGFDYAEVTIGGIKTNAINPESLESYIVPGLYFAGEVLEVHGDLGGYNFQWAWASGVLAGKRLGA